MQRKPSGSHCVQIDAARHVEAFERGVLGRRDFGDELERERLRAG